MKHSRLAPFILGGLLGWGGSASAWAQTILATPSLGVSEQYDDNVNFSSIDPQSDFITAVTPGLRLEVRGHPWSLTASGSVRGEFFADQSELNNFGDNAGGTATLEFRPTPTFGISLTDTVTRTVNPLEIPAERPNAVPETGVRVTGRFVSIDNTIAPAMSYQINPLTFLGLRYSLNTFRSDSPLARDSDTHEAGGSVQRQLSPRNTGTLRYTFSNFQVEESPDQDAHDLRLGLIHAFSPTIRVSAEGGPLFLERPDGTTEVTPAGTLRYDQQFRQGSFSIAYDRSAELAGRIGAPSVSDSLTTNTIFPVTRTLTLALNSVFRQTENSAITETEAVARETDLRVFSNGIRIDYTPLRALSLSLDATASEVRSSDRAVDFLTYSAGVQVNYRLVRWLSLQGGYRTERQNDRTGLNDLEKNVFFIGLTAADTFRAY